MHGVDRLRHQNDREYLVPHLRWEGAYPKTANLELWHVCQTFGTVTESERRTRAMCTHRQPDKPYGPYQELLK